MEMGQGRAPCTASLKPLMTTKNPAACLASVPPHARQPEQQQQRRERSSARLRTSPAADEAAPFEPLRQ